MIGKAGIYENDFQGGLTLFAPPSTPIATYNGGDSSTAFVGDLQIVGSYRVCSHMALRGGYHMLWLDNVAEAGGNASLSLTNPALLRTRTDLTQAFYDGALVGVEFMW